MLERELELRALDNFCGLLPRRGCRIVSECNKGTRAEELFRFPILAPFRFGTSSVFQRLSRIASNGLEYYSELSRTR